MKNDVRIVPSLILICNQLIVVFPSYYTWSSRLRDVNNLYLRSKSQHTCDLDSGASNSEMLFVVHFPYFSWLTVIQLNFAFWILSFAIQTGVFKLYAWEFYGCRNNYRRFEGLKEPFSSVSQTFWKDRLFGAERLPSLFPNLEPSLFLYSPFLHFQNLSIQIMLLIVPYCFCPSHCSLTVNPGHIEAIRLANAIIPSQNFNNPRNKIQCIKLD